jgi:predicted SprT family Zn-dependent metalloprotease
MRSFKNLLAEDGIESLSLTRKEWQIVDTAICGYIAILCLNGASPKHQEIQSILRSVRTLWFENRHERRKTGFCRVCGHSGSDCTGRQRPWIK